MMKIRVTYEDGSTMVMAVPRDMTKWNFARLACLRGTPTRLQELLR